MAQYMCSNCIYVHVLVMVFCRAVQISKKFETRYYEIVLGGLDSAGENRLSRMMVNATDLVVWPVSSSVQYTTVT